jgi:CheY-like chemotaxis protein
MASTSSFENDNCIKAFINKLALIVEDNKVNQTILKNILLKLGFSVEIAQNGYEGYSMCGLKKYDYIFMDIHMPIMDGYLATKQIRTTNNDNSSTVIIAVTADTLDEDRERCLKVGMNEYIAKPICLEHVKNVLQKIHLKY